MMNGESRPATIAVARRLDLNRLELILLRYQWLGLVAARLVHICEPVF
jgi:hypothetical protein